MNRYTLQEMHEGLSATFTKTVTEQDMERFRLLTGDVSPIHMDEEYAKKRGQKGRVVYGMLSASLFSTLAGVYLPGENCLLHSVEAKFAKPVYIGDTLTVSGRVQQVNETFGEVTIKAVVENQHGERVARGVIKAGVEAAAEG